MHYFSYIYDLLFDDYLTNNNVFTDFSFVPRHNQLHRTDGRCSQIICTSNICCNVATQILHNASTHYGRRGK